MHHFYVLHNFGGNLLTYNTTIKNVIKENAEIY